MTVVIYHNPDCSASRNALLALQTAGYEPVVIDYLSEGWTRSHLIGLFAAADVTPRQALREARSPAAELGLLEEGVDDDTLISAMIEHSILVNRPFVCSPKGVRLCRPAEKLLELIDVPAGMVLIKEDGSPLIAA